MALIRVCDHCRKHLEGIDGERENYVNLEYMYKQVGWSNMLTPVDITLCEDCFQKLIGKDLREVFPVPLTTTNIELYKGE